MTWRGKLRSALRPAEGRTAPARVAGPGSAQCGRCGAVEDRLEDGSVPPGWFELLTRELLCRSCAVGEHWSRVRGGQ